MKYALAASMMALGLAACGGGGGAGDSGKVKSAMIAECTEDGESKETCECQVDALEEALGKDDFGKMAKFVQAKDEEGGEKFMMDLMTEKPDIAMKMGMSMMACSTG